MGQDAALDAPKARCDRAKSIPEAPAEDPEEPVVVGELVSVTLGAAIRDFVEELQRPAELIGTFAFLLFALCKRLRLYVWYGARREDLLETYAPWASDYITVEAPFEAIGCRVEVDEITGATSLHAVEDARDINHWMAGIKTGGSHGNGELARDDETVTFQAVYFSLERFVIPTVVDGDCGLDVQCLMLGARRHRDVRTTLRWELSTFFLRHTGNRALIASMFHMGEVAEHLGLFELAAAGASLLVDDTHHHGDGDGAHHGDGVDDGVGAGSGALAVRAFSDEEVLAVRWKRRFRKESPEFVHNVLCGLPECCIKRQVEEYRTRTAPTKPVQAATFLLSRDARAVDRRRAATHFLKFCEQKHGTPCR